MKKKAVLFLFVLLLASIAPGALAFSITNCPVTINDSSTLANDIITASSTCITINASNVTLDCQGYAIRSRGSLYAVYSANQTNITVKGCNLQDINASVPNVGVYFVDVNRSQVYNNTIRLNSSSTGQGYGIILLATSDMISHNNTIENNTITISYENDRGIFLTGSSINNTIIGNTIISNQNGTGITFEEQACANRVLNNNITDALGGPKYLRGIWVMSNDTLIKYNTVEFGGHYGIWIRYYANNNIVADNNLSSSNSESAIAIFLSGEYDDYTNTTNHVENNTITITSPTGSASGIVVNYMVSPRIVNNVVTIKGAIPSNLWTPSINGMYFYRKKDIEANVTVMYNTVTISNTPIDINALGLQIVGNGSRVTGNNITVNNTLLGGLYSEGGYCIFDKNRIEVNSNNATYVINFTNQNRANITNNNLIFSGAGAAKAIFSRTSHYNLFQSNNITTTGASTAGIELLLSNSSIFEKTQINNTLRWIIAGSGTQNNFTNTTFIMLSGKINMPHTFVLNGSDEITKQKLNVTSNKAYLASASLPYLNTTGIITLFGLNYTTPRLLVDWNDDGTYETCPADTCTLLSGSPAEGYIFNVSHFTTFSTTEGGLNISLTKTDSSDPITAGNPLTYTITIAVTNLDPAITNISNLTVTDIYPDGIVFSTSQPDAVSGTNNTFVLGNLTANQTIVLNITVNLPLALSGTTINNTANLSYNNVNGTQINLTITEPTTVLSPGGGDGGGGGSGGGGGGRVYRPLNTTTAAGYCFESWVCDDWSECINAKQTRTCTDLKACGTTKLKPAEEQDCIYTPKPIPKASPEEPPAKTYQEPVLVVEPKAKTPLLDKVFYVLAVIALVAMGLYLYWLRRKKTE
ncbi:MAG: right-handed parallel beta-helix repeat-containing protein [Candidatus Woesearchaeota archaeon]